MPRAKQVSMSVTGFRQADRKLAGLGKGLQNKALRKGCREVAKLVRKQVVAAVPRLTGALAKSIVVRARKRSRKHKNDVAVVVRTKEGFFQGNQFYAGFLEFGTEPRRTKSGKYLGAIKPGRYFRDSLYSFPDRKRRIFQAEIRRYLATLRVRKPNVR